MLTNGHKKDCGFADEIVSYIYDEIEGGERVKFELHLASCSSCTDEFAAMSEARFSVFEWQKEEFAPLATPEFVIPVERKPVFTTDDKPAGFFDSIRNFFASPGLRIAFAAVLLIFAGLGFVAVKYLGSREQSIAANTIAPVVSPKTVVPEEPQTLAAKTVDTPAAVKDERVTTPKELRSSPEIRPVRAVQPRHVMPERQLTANATEPEAPKKPNPVQNRKAPVLNNYDDNDDKSLRLADLLDEEVGAKF